MRWRARAALTGVAEPSTALLVGITLSASTMAGAAALAGLVIRRRRAD